MNAYRNLAKVAVLGIAMNVAMNAAPALAQTSVAVEQGRHHYVFYSDRDIYFSPETKLYFWQESGRWNSALTLPPESAQYVARAKGIEIDLDTEKPYERNAWVVARYRDDTTVKRKLDASDRFVGGRTLTNGQRPSSHRYVYYANHGIYFAPDRNRYYWQSDGRWNSGAILPAEFEATVRSGGVAIELDTDRPYERDAYVIARYGHRQDRDSDD